MCWVGGGRVRDWREFSIVTPCAPRVSACDGERGEECRVGCGRERGRGGRGKWWGVRGEERESERERARERKSKSERERECVREGWGCGEKRESK